MVIELSKYYQIGRGGGLLVYADTADKGGLVQHCEKYADVIIE